MSGLHRGAIDGLFRLEDLMSFSKLNITHWFPNEALSETLLKELDCTHPFGEANPDPIFGIRKTQFLHRLVTFGERDIHFRFQIPGANGRLVNGVAWHKGNNLPPVHTPIDLACKLNWNRWNGQKYLQAELIDWRLAA